MEIFKILLLIPSWPDDALYFSNLIETEKTYISFIEIWNYCFAYASKTIIENWGWCSIRLFVSAKFNERTNKVFVRFVSLFSKIIIIAHTCFFIALVAKLRCCRYFTVFFWRIFQPIFESLVFLSCYSLDLSSIETCRYLLRFLKLQIFQYNQEWFLLILWFVHPQCFVSNFCLFHDLKKQINKIFFIIRQFNKLSVQSFCDTFFCSTVFSSDQKSVMVWNISPNRVTNKKNLSLKIWSIHFPLFTRVAKWFWTFKLKDFSKLKNLLLCEPKESMLKSPQTMWSPLRWWIVVKYFKKGLKNSRLLILVIG